MEVIKEFIQPFLNVLGRFMPNAFGALIVLILGWVLIILAAKGLGKVLSMVKLDQRLQGSKDKPAVKLEPVITRVVRYMLLVCLFLLVLEILGVPDALDPVKDMFTKLLGAFPNIVAAFLIAIIGYILAQVLGSVVTVVLKGADKLNPKIGLSENFSLAKLLGQLVFIAIFIPILIMAFETLDLEAVSGPATSMLDALFSAVPNILGAAIILAVAFFVGRFVTSVISELLKNLGADVIPEKLGVGHVFSEKATLSRCVGAVILVFIMLGAALSAVEMLQLTLLSGLLTSLTAFAAQIAMGVVILAIGSAIAKLAHNALLASGTSPFLATLARVAIIGLVVAMGLELMGIGQDIIRLAFGFTIGGVSVAFALAFGLGGREAAGKQLEAWFQKMRGGK
ncbi:MAG: mechanosensitive ion channel [Lentisphaeria bacterium]|nr:mechanosensitive ion channel [Lentisphaeria bacterium]